MYQSKSRRLAAIVGLIVVFSVGALAKDAKIRINVYPKQAYVFVDGVPFRDSSQTIRIAPGNHTIGAYNYGFTPQVRDVSAEPGSNPPIEFRLEAIPGMTTGPWGRIQIEGASRAAVLLNGKTPEYLVGHGDEFNHGGTFLPCCIQQLVVPAGAHQVTIVERGKELWSGTINVVANQRVILDVVSGKQKVKPWSEGAAINSLARFKAGIASATVAVAPVSGNIAAQPAQINCGDSSRLTWETAETVRRLIMSDEDKIKQPTASGELSVLPKKTTSYDLQASGPGGTLVSTATVNVNTAVQSSLQASPAEIRYRRIGDKVVEQSSTNLTWSTSNANAASIEPLGEVSTNNSQMVKPASKQQDNGPVNETQTYTLTAKNDCGGSDTQTVSVRITGSIEPIPEVLLASVFFATGQPAQSRPEDGLAQSQQELLARTADGFKKYLEYDPEARLRLVGNADERDSNAKNKPLSQRRADRVRQYLVSLGISESKIETVAQGKKHPLDATTVKQLHEENPNKAAKPLGSFQDLVWAYNRRVDIVLFPKGEVSKQYFPGTAADAKLLFDSNWPERTEKVTLASQKVRLPAESHPKEQQK